MTLPFGLPITVRIFWLSLLPQVLVIWATVANSEPSISRDCPQCPEMVSIPIGSFMMGANEDEEDREQTPEQARGFSSPQRQVTLTRAFSVSRTEITKSQFRHFHEATDEFAPDSCFSLAKENKSEAQSNANWLNPGFDQTEEDPVVCVSWQQAQRYVTWLSKLSGRKYRLLSEAEWEFAARGGTSSARYWGNDREVACQFGNVRGEEFRQWFKGEVFPDAFFRCSDGFVQTAPVGRFRPNAFGLHDMLGNAAEWIEDCWSANYKDAFPRQMPRTVEGCKQRTARGASWLSVPRWVRSAFRMRQQEYFSGSDTGFRVARDD